MKHPRLSGIIERAVHAARSDGPALGDTEGTVDVREYTDPTRLAGERARLFRRMPIPLAHASEIADRRAIVRELDGVSLLLVRDASGAARAFKNACRHRGARLCADDAAAQARGPVKAFVCPYHGWTYGTDGALLHVPHACAFTASTPAGLAAVDVEERHGLLWVRLDPTDGPSVAEHLGELDEELGALGLGSHVVGARVVTEQRGNWKMLMEAFLDGYHIRTLHRDSVYPFFVDAKSIVERAGVHVRSASARRASRESPARPLRDLATATYSLFPCTTLVLHPDWTSLVVVQPLAPDRFVWSHLQLLAEAPSTDEARAHFERSFGLIEGRVFQGEDLRIIAETHAGLATGANERLTFGLLESPAVWFHEAVRAALR